MRGSGRKELAERKKRKFYEVVFTPTAPRLVLNKYLLNDLKKVFSYFPFLTIIINTPNNTQCMALFLKVLLYMNFL